MNLKTYYELGMQRVQHDGRSDREAAMASSAMAQENILISTAAIHLTGKRVHPENSARNTHHRQRVLKCKLNDCWLQIVMIRNNL